MTISRHIRPDGRTAYRVQLLVEGVRKSYGLFDTVEAADEAERAQKATLDASAKGTTVGQLGAAFIVAHEKRHRGDGRYASLWRRYLADSFLAKMPVAKVRLPNVVRWMRETERCEATATRVVGERGQHTTTFTSLHRPISRQTLAHAFHLLRAFFAWAILDAKVTQDPTRDASLPDGPPPLWTWLRPEEIAAVLGLPVTAKLERAKDGSESGCLTPAQLAIYTLAIYTGLRASELWHLRWNAVRLDGQPEIVVAASTKGGPTKTGLVRHVPLLKEALRALVAWREVSPGIGNALVFPGRRGRAHPSGFDAGWSEALDASGVRAGRVKNAPAGERQIPHFHDLRHTCASHLVQGTWTPALDLYRVGNWLGHKSIVSTQRYAHLAPDGLHAAIGNRANLSRELSGGSRRKPK